MGKKKQQKTIKRDLPYTHRKMIAKEMADGLMVKQAAGKYSITLAYAYQIFYEFLEWKMEWKHKEILDGNSCE